MKAGNDILSDLLALTQQLARSTDPGADVFGEKLERRWELLQQLVAAGLNPEDGRLGSLIEESSVLQARMQAHVDSLTDELGALERASAAMEGIRGTLPTRGNVLDVRA